MLSTSERRGHLFLPTTRQLAPRVLLEGIPGSDGFGSLSEAVPASWCSWPPVRLRNMWTSSSPAHSARFPHLMPPAKETLAGVYFYAKLSASCGLGPPSIPPGLRLSPGVPLPSAD